MFSLVVLITELMLISTHCSAWSTRKNNRPLFHIHTFLSPCYKHRLSSSCGTVRTDAQSESDRANICALRELFPPFGNINATAIAEKSGYHCNSTQIFGDDVPLIFPNTDKILSNFPEKIGRLLVVKSVLK